MPERHTLKYVIFKDTIGKLKRNPCLCILSNLCLFLIYSHLFSPLSDLFSCVWGVVVFSIWGKVGSKTRDAEHLTADILEFAAKIQLGSQMQITLL